jgi:hypothetical protein
VDFQDISRKIAISQGLSVMVAGKKVIFILIVPINQREDGRIIKEVSPKEEVDSHLEVAVAARTTMEKEAGTLED